MILHKGGFVFELELCQEPLDRLLWDMRQAIQFSKEIEISQDG